MMRRKSYTLAFLLGGALLVVLCVLIFSNPGGNNTPNFVHFTPTEDEELTNLATGLPGQDFGAWLDNQQDTAPPENYVPPPVETPVPTPAPVTPEPTRSGSLRNGDQGTDVAYVQQRLRDLGYLSGRADGIFGNATERAVRDFQAANGLTADGVVGPRTMRALESTSARPQSAAVGDTSRATPMPTPRSYTASTPNATFGFLAPGNSGSRVTNLQRRLIELGYLSGSASGTYDEATEQAVRAFQARNGQWVDGLAGPDTQTALFASGALAAPRD